MKRAMLKSGGKIFISTQTIDMRKSINGLAAIVQNDFDLDLYEDAMFVFANRAKDKIKILYWDSEGFCLYYKRLERGRFRWPDNFREGKVNELSGNDLRRLLRGLAMEAYVKKPNYRVT